MPHCSLVICAALLVLHAGLSAGDAPKPLTPVKALTLVKQYLAERDETKKQALLAQAGDNPVDPTLLAKALTPDAYPTTNRSGEGLKLTVPASVSATPAEYALSLPGGYTTNKLWPLIIGLHGGGAGTGSGNDYIRSMSGVGEAFVVCPTSLDLDNNLYWRNPRNEEMLILLIREMKQKFAIDPDRVYLSGYSMGGIGTYYYAPRMCDRFAAVAPGGGSWRAIFWRQLLNTPTYIWHGKNDMRGPTFTDFPNATHAAACLKDAGCVYELRVMDCDHFKVPSDETWKMAKWLLSKKRDPYPKHIVHASPCGANFGTPSVPPAPPDRWLTIDRIGSERLEVDSLSRGGVDRIKYTLTSGVLDATWTATNVLEIKATNVKAFRVFLSPKLVDFKKPLRIVVNDAPGFDGPVASSLAFGMRYIDERRDAGMIFVNEVIIDLEALGNAKK